MKKIILVTCIILIILIGIYIGIKMNNNSNKESNLHLNQNGSSAEIKDNINITTVEITSNKEKTTPNTLIEYKIYYTKCRHYITKYEDIDESLVNLTEEQFKEKSKKWKIEKFSAEEIKLIKETEEFCNEHYKLKLENNTIVIYKIDENGIEEKYEQTSITTEYLTEEDILKLSSGIIIYGKENLISTIEDYE